jgi:cytochrome c
MVYPCTLLKLLNALSKTDSVEPEKAHLCGARSAIGKAVQTGGQWTILPSEFFDLVEAFHFALEGQMRKFAFVSTFLCLAANPALPAPIHDAAKKGDVAALAALLEQGVDANSSNGLATPLYYAVAGGHLEAATLLINNKADVNAKSIWGVPLISACSNGYGELTALLLEHGAKTDVEFDSRTPLHLAARAGCLACVDALIQAGADVNALTSRRQPPIHDAMSKGHKDVAAYLIQKGYAAPRPEPISPRLAAGDPEIGRQIFTSKCAGCHFVEDGKKTKLGPNLWGIAGRARASYQGFPYSEALRAWKGDWSFEDLNFWLAGPAIAVPGTAMEFAGFTDETERAHVISYLRLQSPNPIPLP